MDAFDKWRDAQSSLVSDTIRTAQPGAAGLSDAIAKTVDKNASDFLATVPEDLRPQYQVTINRARSDLFGTAKAYEVKERTRFEGANLDDTVNRKIIGAASSPADVASQRHQQAEAEAFIKANPYLTPVEKDARLRALPDQFAIGVGNSVNADKAANAAIFAGGASGPQANAATGGDHHRIAANILRKEEGFRESPYWDVNAYRTGYGSDTTTRADGSVEKVTTGTIVSRADSERDLARRLGEFEAGAREKVGVAWDALPANAKGALLSVAYNYGSLPGKVAKAIQDGGGLEAIASAVSGLSANKNRRQNEAAVIRGSDVADNAPSMAVSQNYWANAYPGASADVIQRLAAQSVAARNRFDQEEAARVRAGIEAATVNAPVAFQNTGTYTGEMPTPEQFQLVYGADEGTQKYENFQASVEVAQTANGMQTMPTAEIQRVVEAAQPVSTGNDAALEQKKYETLANAAASIVKARTADPVAYVQQAFPAVREAWDRVQEDPSKGYSAALRETAAAQTFLGIPPEQQALLPAATSKQIITAFENTNAPEADRVQAVTSAIFSTPDPNQRRAIFNQMVKDGLPPIAEGALEAAARNDMGAASRLMQAVLVKPSDIGGKLASTPAQIDAAIQENVLATGQIGATSYGLSYADAAGYERAARGTDLMKRSVQLRMLQGQDLDEAVKGAKTDLFGDKKVYSGSWTIDADLPLNKDVDEDTVGRGLAAVRPEFRQALTQMQDAAIARSTGDQSEGVGTILKATAENRIDDIINSGVFVQSGDGIGLRDPYTGLFVAGADGKPFTVRYDRLMAIGSSPEGKAAQDRLTGIDREMKAIEDSTPLFGAWSDMGGAR